MAQLLAGLALLALATGPLPNPHPISVHLRSSAVPRNLEPQWTAEDVRQVLRDASPLARCIVTHEIGGRGFDPYATGSQGEAGPAQLHPQGKLRTFLEAGYTDPYSPAQAIAFLEHELLAGQGAAWSPISRGLC